MKVDLTKHFGSLHAILETQSRDRLRRIAKDLGVPRGRDKKDTIKNILKNKSPQLFMGPLPELITVEVKIYTNPLCWHTMDAATPADA